MADPITIVSLGATAASTFMGAAGAAQQNQAAAAASQYQAAIARNNAIIAKQNAQFAVQTGRQQSFLKDLETRSLRGKQIAGMAASGFEISGGSFSDVIESTESLGELDKSLILQGASKNAHAYLAQAANFNAESTLYSMKADSYTNAADFAVASSLIGGAAGFADKWMTYRRIGAV